LDNSPFVNIINLARWNHLNPLQVLGSPGDQGRNALEMLILGAIIISKDAFRSAAMKFIVVAFGCPVISHGA
jgi:hypothetical protein